MLAAATKAFLLPGNLVSDFVGIVENDDRGMMRTLINMLFWNLIGATLAFYLA